jgi:hypothetical protein
MLKFILSIQQPQLVDPATSSDQYLVDLDSISTQWPAIAHINSYWQYRLSQYLGRNMAYFHGNAIEEFVLVQCFNLIPGSCLLGPWSYLVTWLFILY